MHGVGVLVCIWMDVSSNVFTTSRSVSDSAMQEGFAYDLFNGLLDRHTLGHRNRCRCPSDDSTVPMTFIAGCTCRDMRACTWLGKWVHGPWQKQYIFSIEDPFDDDDNPARSVGSATRSGGKELHIARAFATAEAAVRQCSELIQGNGNSSGSTQSHTIAVRCVMQELFGCDADDTQTTSSQQQSTTVNDSQQQSTAVNSSSQHSTPPLDLLTAAKAALESSMQMLELSSGGSTSHGSASSSNRAQDMSSQTPTQPCQSSKQASSAVERKTGPHALVGASAAAAAAFINTAVAASARQHGSAADPVANLQPLAGSTAGSLQALQTELLACKADLKANRKTAAVVNKQVTLLTREAEKETSRLEVDGSPAEEQVQHVQHLIAAADQKLAELQQLRVAQKPLKSKVKKLSRQLAKAGGELPDRHLMVPVI